MIEPSQIWKCNYCGKTETQSGARALALPPVPPKGWIRVMLTRLEEVPASEGRKKSEELRTVMRDACPPCAVGVDAFLCPVVLT